MSGHEPSLSPSPEPLPLYQVAGAMGTCGLSDADAELEQLYKQFAVVMNQMADRRYRLKSWKLERHEMGDGVHQCLTGVFALRGESIA